LIYKETALLLDAFVLPAFWVFPNIPDKLYALLSMNWLSSLILCLRKKTLQRKKVIIFLPLWAGHFRKGIGSSCQDGHRSGSKGLKSNTPNRTIVAFFHIVSPYLVVILPWAWDSSNWKLFYENTAFHF
jgi:hypothetical protein